MKRHNIHVRKMNNIYVCFAQLIAVTKLKLLKSHCYRLYGCELWDLAHTNVDDICIAWRKGVKRVGMPVNMYNLLVLLLCDSKLLLDELYHRSMLVVSQCLHSDCLLVNKIA